MFNLNNKQDGFKFEVFKKFLPEFINIVNLFEDLMGCFSVKKQEIDFKNFERIYKENQKFFNDNEISYETSDLNSTYFNCLKFVFESLKKFFFVNIRNI
jgi:hypothetical protein